MLRSSASANSNPKHGMNNVKKVTRVIVILACWRVSALVTAAPMGTAFTYQGKLNDGGGPATGLYDFQLKLFTGPANADPQVGSSLSQLGVGVTNGLFTVKLDFGAQFPGEARWLEIW